MPLARLWHYFRKRRAIRAYVRTLGPLLRRIHGRRKHYTAGQVRDAAGRAGLGTSYLCYAYAIYCGPVEFNRHHRETGEVCDYEAMRAEVAHTQFGGDASFSTTDVLDAADHGGWMGGDVGSDGGGGGDGGGD